MPPQQSDSIETLYVDIAARADQLVKDADAAVQAVVKKLDEIDRKTEETEQSFGNLGAFIRDALSTAAGIGLAKVGATLTGMIADFGRAMIDSNAQMQMYERSFTTLTGSAEEAGDIIAWVKEQAKATPFDVPGLIQASQQLMTWGLDLEEWFTVVGDTAAAMNRPISQVVNAVGTLASGQTGEAVRRFRDLGINLREYSQLEFDARGAMITPLEEAIPIVRQIMIERFGGMMESQSDTWAGVMSNMQDTWQQFVQVVGEPVFEILNETLRDVYAWVEKNEDGIENFARQLGNALGNALTILMDVLEGFGKLVGVIDELMTAVTGTPDWVKEGISAGRKVGGLAAGGIRGAGHLIGGVIAGEGIDTDAAAAAMAETASNVAGVRQEVELLTLEQEELTRAQQAGVDAVYNLYDGYRNLREEYVVQLAEQGNASRAWSESLGLMERMGLVADGTTDAYNEQTSGVQEMARAYNEASAEVENQAARIEELRGRMEALRAEQAANLEKAQEVAAKLGDRLRKTMEEYKETIAKMAAETASAIEEIESEAAQAEADAINDSQDRIGKLREEFARDQIRRREKFNREWARLLREQNQEIIDAEWEYQFQKENLLIEGDEIALAELEARYKHEKEVRSREHQDARSDLSERYDAENRQRQEDFERRIREMEAQLQKEVESIRESAREEVAAKKEALEERLQHEEEALNERLGRIGEMLSEEVGENQTAANIVMETWRQAYGDQVANAVNAGMVMRQELDAIRQAAVQAASAVANVRMGSILSGSGRSPVTGGPGGGRRHEGGYTPRFGESTVITQPGEFVTSPATTAAMEAAISSPLTDTAIRQFVSRRNILDVNVNATGVPADQIAQLRSEIVEAIMDDESIV